MWSVLLCLIALGIISLTHFVYRWRNPTCNGRLPPGSMGFPLIGESIQFFIPSKSFDTPQFFKKRIARYGTLFRTSLAGRPVIVSSDPEFNYYIFQQEGKLVEMWYMDSLSTVFGGEASDAVNISYIHRYTRNLVLDHLGTECLKQKLLFQMEAMANQYLRSWSSQPSVELKESISTMVLDFTSKHLFNYDLSNSMKNLRKMFSSILQAVGSLPLNIPGTAFHRSLKDWEALLNYMKDILHERLASPEKSSHGDFLDQIIDDMKKEEFLTEKLVVSLMAMILYSTFETISATITAGMTFLTDNPLVVKELLEEQEAIINIRENVDSPIKWKEYKSMTFLSQVVNEILRVSSVGVGMLRKTIKDIHINGYVIPKGWTIMVVSSALHLNPDKFEDPLAFNPWRWKNLGANTKAKSFIPFGGGMRNCSGAEFTRVLISVFLHVMLTKFSWTKIKGGHVTRTPFLTFNNGFHVKISKNREMKGSTCTLEETFLASLDENRDKGLIM